MIISVLANARLIFGAQITLLTGNPKFLECLVKVLSHSNITWSPETWLTSTFIAQKLHFIGSPALFLISFHHLMHPVQFNIFLIMSFLCLKYSLKWKLFRLSYLDAAKCLSLFSVISEHIFCTQTNLGNCYIFFSTAFSSILQCLPILLSILSMFVFWIFISSPELSPDATFSRI